MRQEATTPQPRATASRWRCRFATTPSLMPASSELATAQQMGARIPQRRDAIRKKTTAPTRGGRRRRQGAEQASVCAEDRARGGRSLHQSEAGSTAAAVGPGAVSAAALPRGSVRAAEARVAGEGRAAGGRLAGEGRAAGEGLAAAGRAAGGRLAGEGRAAGGRLAAAARAAGGRLAA